MRTIWGWFWLVYCCVSVLAAGSERGASERSSSTAVICRQYMQCTKALEDSVSTLVLRFNQTMWNEYRSTRRAFDKEEFDFTGWSWTELDEISLEHELIEVIFNGLEIPRIDALEGHGSVTSLNLDGNQIATIEVEAFGHFTSVTRLSLRNNMLTAINYALFYFPNRLEHLDLSGNAIRDINGFNDLKWPQLRYLNLSHNHIETVRNQLFKLVALETLDLSHNAIKSGERPIILPSAVRRLLLDHNELTAWPFDSVPNELTDLSLRFNSINSTKQASGVQRLSLSSNRLESFCSYCFPALEELDLSGNYFDHIPRLSNATDVWPVKKLAFNRMPHLRAIGKDAFDGAANLKEIEISFCPRLSHIDSNAFTDLLQLQRLDLSYNGLEQLSEDMANWGKIKHGVDLQGNPINCNCSMQWLVDDVIPAWHAHRALHHLFEKLRCARPPAYRDYLLVYLTVHDNLLCRQYREMNLPGMEHVAQLMKEQRELETTRMQKMILTGLIVAIIITSAYLVYLKCRTPRYNVRPLYF
uniref:LRRCT domain-containing protein n=1 Tax=Anopheles dirus TaxID=7168 RepID=A0A182NBT1_9DIPT